MAVEETCTKRSDNPIGACEVQQERNPFRVLTVVPARLTQWRYQKFIRKLTGGTAACNYVLQKTTRSNPLPVFAAGQK